jgi:signal transduction histidine kinase
VTVRTPDSGLESLERRYEALERFLPFLLLAAPMVPYVLSQDPSAGAVGITAGLAVAAAGGFGLIAMRQRVHRLAGQLEVESEPGAGTAVSASLPAIPLGSIT